MISFAPIFVFFFHVYWKFVGNEINWKVRSRANVPRAPGGCRHGSHRLGSAVCGQGRPAQGRPASPAGRWAELLRAGSRRVAMGSGRWPPGGRGARVLTRRASARSWPAHRCLSTLLDTGLSVTGFPLRRGERVRKGGPPLRGSLPGTRSLVWGRGHPTSQSRPGSPAPHHGLRVSDSRHRLKAFLYTSALRCTPLSDPSGGRGPDPRLDRDPSVSLGLPPAPRDPADGGGDSRPQGPLHSWNEILVLCALPSAV